MRQILIIDDDPQISQFLVSSLKGVFRVLCASSVKDAERELEKSVPNLILLDVDLPDGNGFKFCAKLKKTPKFADIPVIFLTSEAELSDKVMGLSLGAEDYVTKPFEIEELRARIDARFRKISEAKAKQEELRAGDLILYSNYQRAAVVSPTDGQETPFDLTSLEFRLLFLLASHEDQVFSRNQLMDAVWGSSVHITDRVVDTHLSNLRKKMTASSYTILAVHGVGYRFCAKEAEKLKRIA